MSPDFRNSALFICYSFIGGNFRHGHILYDPNLFNDNLISEIDSNCPSQIPWLATDITKSSLLPVNSGERTDHILQLIFLDPEHLVEKISEFERYLTFYRIFIFVSTGDEVETKGNIHVVRNVSPNALVVHYNAANGSLVVHLTSKTDEAIECLEGDKCQMEDPNINEPARIKDRSVDEHVFDRTFGHNKRMQSIIIGTPGIFVQKQGHKSYIP